MGEETRDCFLFIFIRRSNKTPLCLLSLSLFPLSRARDVAIGGGAGPRELSGKLYLNDTERSEMRNRIALTSACNFVKPAFRQCISRISRGSHASRAIDSNGKAITSLCDRIM